MARSSSADYGGFQGFFGGNEPGEVAARGTALLDCAVASLVSAWEKPEDGYDPSRFPPWMALPGACFVTLKRSGALRGCIGSLEPRSSLGQDVWENTRAAAFRDPRFPPLELDELDGLEISVSLVGPLEPLQANSLEALMAELRPGVDGVFVQAGGKRATFLPAVWEDLREPRSFLGALWRKAGWFPGTWPQGIQVFRYPTVSFEAPIQRLPNGEWRAQSDLPG
jgi:hypothetical protein